MLVAEEESVALVSAAVVMTSGSVADDSVDVGRGSKEKVWLICGTEVAVVFCTDGSCGEEDSAACGGTDTVM